jgi:hypothetical protein
MPEFWVDNAKNLKSDRLAINCGLFRVSLSGGVKEAELPCMDNLKMNLKTSILN